MTRFTHSLTFNCVPEWRQGYLHYAALKKTLHAFERARFTQKRFEDARLSAKERSEPFGEEDTLRAARKEVTRIENDFHQSFAEDLNAVSIFYGDRKKEATDAVQKLRHEIPTRPISTSAEHVDKASAGDFEEHLKQTYGALNDLADFLEMNWNGFERIVGKYERMVSSADSSRALREAFKASQLKMSDQEAIHKDIAACEDMWARFHASTQRDACIAELRAGLRERLAFERATVWQEMAQQERRALAVEAAPAPAAKAARAASHVQAWWKQAISLFVAFAVLAAIVVFPVFKDGATNRCLAVVSCLCILWCTEALPLYATAMLLPALAVVLKVQRGANGKVIENSEEATKLIFGHFFSPNILLLLGGFSIASALSKYGVTKGIATFVLSRSSRKPKFVILTNMFLCTFLSMWISNIAASVLCFSLIAPILKQLSHDHPLAKALVLGIAYAANIGGLSSPISSPQNVIGLGVLRKDRIEVGFIQWLIMAIPTSIAGILLSWLVLIVVFPVGARLIESAPSDKKTTSIRERRFQFFVSAVAALTIVLFCLGKLFARSFPMAGEMGIVAVVPLILYFGSGALSKDDFNGFMWNIVMLAMGGSALGHCVESSGLLNEVGLLIQARLAGMSMMLVVLIFCFVILIATSFISHTVGAFIFLPLMSAVGKGLNPPRPGIVVMAACFMCSAGMGLPISGFPNMNAVAQEDAQGRPYVGTKDFAKSGLLASFLFYLVIMGIGVPLMIFCGI